MTTFLRLLADSDKANALLSAADAVKTGAADKRVFDVKPDEFKQVPGTPFAYWISPETRGLFTRLPLGETDSRQFSKGLCTTLDERFVRTYWEIDQGGYGRYSKWSCYANGGRFSRFYWEYPAVVLTEENFSELREYLVKKFPYLKGNASWLIHDENDYEQAVVSWPLRTHAFSPQILPRHFVFSARTYAALVPETKILGLVGFLASSSVDFLLKTTLGREGHPEFVNGALKSLPFPELEPSESNLSALAHQAWSLRRNLFTVDETSHAFLLPAALRARVGDYDPPAIESELARIQAEIDDIAFNLYGFSDADRAAVTQPLAAEDGYNTEDEAEEEDDEAVEAPADAQSALLSWAVGVTFGRFDWRLATGERAAPPEPDPFDPLPAQSPGMLPDGAVPFHTHAGILVDDPGHPHDLAHLVEEVLARVVVAVPEDVRRWLQRDFFPFHLQRYSKSRRKAPIYWPLSTTSGSYTLWVYYPALSNQTLYTAINDFVEPKLKQVSEAAAQLRNKGASRSRAEEKQFEELQAFELELIELRDTLLKLAPTYKPSHDDGVQISAAPLWPLFRHKPWQKVLKDTWEKLKKGDYDWAHLAMNYWPDRVREKCKTDKSLAIAHGLEELYVEPEAKPKKTRSGKTKGV
ncbi:MAG: type II restriction endonuclease subunit M [Pseudomonadota bacterium]